MPTIGWSEMLLLAVVAIVVVGPKELPRLVRVVGHWMGKARAAAREFQDAFDDLARESGVDEMRRKMDDLRRPDFYSRFEDGEPDEAPRAAGGNEPDEAPRAVGGNEPDRAAAAKGSDETVSPEGDQPAAGPENRPVTTH